MKNRSLFLLLPIVLLAVVYFISKDFALSFSKVSDMLKSSNTNSLQMFFYDWGNFGWLVSVMISIYAFLVPIFPKATVFIANQAYFGQVIGTILVVVAMIIALGYIFILGRWIGKLIKGNIENLKWISLGITLLSSVLIVVAPLSIIGVLLGGIISRKSKSGLITIAIGTILAGIIQIIF